MREDRDPYSQDYGGDTSGSSSAAADPWTPDELAQAQQWANEYYTSHQIPSSYGTPDDLANNYAAQRRNGLSHQAAMDAVPGLLGWDKYQPATTPPTPTPGPGPGPTGNLGSLISPFTGTFTAPQQSGLPSTPTFTPPAYGKPAPFSYGAFKGPDAQSVLNDPGYQFRLGQGEQALQQSAAAKGTLNGGATQKAVLGYGQDYASNEFNNVWNRDLTEYNTNRQGAFNEYMTNYQTQYLDPYKFAYQGAQDAFAPQMAGYQTEAAWNQHQNDSDLNSAWNQYLQSISNFRDQRDSTFNKQFSVASS